MGELNVPSVAAATLRAGGGRRASMSPNVGLIGQPDGAARLMTPALVLDRPVFLANLRAMQARCAAAGLSLRPHAKTHKSAVIAQAQIEAGAVGICCATPHEVLALGQAGVPDILLTSPVADPERIRQLARLSRSLSLGVVVDHPSQVTMWTDAVEDRPSRLRVLVDVDIGMGRTGVRMDQVTRLARLVEQAPNLTFDGVQAYSGQVQHIASFVERQATYGAQLDELRQRLVELERAGLPPRTVTGGGTGTMSLDMASGVFTEVQGGSYAFMDVEYNEVELVERDANPFASSLFVKALVISANVQGHVTLNAGFKCLSADGPAPRPAAASRDWRYMFFGDEYGRLAGSDLPGLGEAVALIVPHCDPTVNLHDVYHVVEDGTLVDIWDIDARGVL